MSQRNQVAPPFPRTQECKFPNYNHSKRWHGKALHLGVQWLDHLSVWYGYRPWSTWILDLQRGLHVRRADGSWFACYCEYILFCSGRVAMCCIHRDLNFRIGRRSGAANRCQMRIFSPSCIRHCVDWRWASIRSPHVLFDADSDWL